MKDPADRVRNMTVATYFCRSCHYLVIRRFFSVKDYDCDVMAQNQLCMRCYLDGKYEPVSLVEGGTPSTGPEGKTEQ